MCTASREYHCWQSVSVHGPTARQKLAAAIWGALEELHDFELVFRAETEAAIASSSQEQLDREQELTRRESALRRQKDNVGRSLREYGPSLLIAEELQNLVAEDTRLAFDRDQLARSRRRAADVPDLDAVRRLLSEALEHECHRSREATRLLRQFVSDIRVWPVQLLDGRRPMIRASVTLDFSPPGSTDSSLRRTLIVDLFDPQQREAIREQLVEMRSCGVTEREAAQRLGVTITAAQRAARLQRLMDQAGVTDAYRRLHQPPDNPRRFRRHLHPRFRQQSEAAANNS